MEKYLRLPRALLPRVGPCKLAVKTTGMDIASAGIRHPKTDALASKVHMLNSSNNTLASVVGNVDP